MPETTKKPKVGVNRGNAGKGRPKGSKNKFTSDVKSMVLKALDDAGGAAYLLQQAQDNPTAFMTLVGKVLPTTLAGDKENPVALVEIPFRSIPVEE